MPQELEPNVDCKPPTQPPAPTISIIVPTYNSEKTIGRALSSIRCQTFSDVEVILVDDTSTDRTIEIARNYSDFPLRILINEHNCGVAATRNRGLSHAIGRYVAFLDSDDEWLAPKLDMQIAAARAHPDAVLISSEAKLFDQSGTCVGLVNPERPRPSGDQAWKLLLAYPSPHTSTIIAKRDALLQVGGFNETLLTGEDQDLWIRLALVGPVIHVQSTLVNAYAIPNSVSNQYSKLQHKFLLPLIRFYVEQNTGALSKSEIRAIFRRRFFDFGKDLCIAGNIALGAMFLLRSIAQGGSPRGALEILISFSLLGKIARTIRNKFQQSRPLKCH